MDQSLRRWVSYGGLLFVVLIAVALFAAPMSPGSNATAAKVTGFYHQHQSVFYFQAYAIVLAIIVGLTYFWHLREWLGREPASQRLLNVGFAGAVVFAVSGGVGAGLSFALADASHAGNVSGTTMQTLNLLTNDFNIGMAAAGTALFLLATGIAVIRHGGMPRWLGWVAVVFGVISVTGFVGPMAAGLWILASSITLIATERRTVPAATSAPAPA